MAINFDTLPKEHVSNTPEPGIYKFEITKAEMKAPYNNVGDDYLAISMKISTLDGKPAGFLNDKIVENPKPAVGYKINRLIRALDLGIEGTMELSDLTKLIVGSKGFVSVTTFTPEGKQPIAIVDLFNYDCYYKKSERGVVEEAISPKKTTIADVVESDDDLPFETAPTTVNEDSEY